MKAALIAIIIGIITVLLSVSFAATGLIYDFLMPKIAVGAVIGLLVYFVVLD